MHAEAVIGQLGLIKSKNSFIGGPLLRGVSGGERKKVSIGQEMLINPSLLFLDEPTSGLDSTAAQRIVSTLLELAKGGRTIVLTIHQPSSRLFYMFHKVLLLSEGNPLYFGQASAAMDYFSSIGYAPSVAMNPSDFLLDLANGVTSNESLKEQTLVKKTLISAYKTNIAEKLKHEIQEINNHPADQLENGKFARWATTWWQQFTVLLQRGVKERKHESFCVFNIAQIGLLFFSSGFWGTFPLFQAIFTFPQERMMLEKERSSGMPRTSPWCLGKDLKSATVLGSVIMLSFLLAGGFYVQHVPPFISWIKYISINHYTYKLFLGSQYKPNETYHCGDPGKVCLIGDFPSIKTVGLDEQVSSAIALAIMLVAYRLIAYLALMRIGVTKKLEN
ncbi:hypothetical protein REPUB_Repub11eG0066600 [Reevesia pubescens]